MTLSGWTRLWIVGAVIWWAAGAWWVSQDFGPVVTHVYGAPITVETADPAWPPEPQRYSPVQEPPGGWQAAQEPSSTIEDWSPFYWRLGFVVLFPFAVAMVVVGIRGVAMWVWRGFRPKTHRANSN